MVRHVFELADQVGKQTRAAADDGQQIGGNLFRQSRQDIRILGEFMRQPPDHRLARWRFLITFDLLRKWGSMPTRSAGGPGCE